MMFDVTVALAALNAVADYSNTTPQKWIDAWKSLEVELKDYIYALNDYGFFLQQAGKHDEAVKILGAVIKQDPDRASAQLNLADSLWALERKAEARSHYKIYNQLMIKANRTGEIPQRVRARLG
jgi:tetratricopeptide (TPR) repeat protein